MGSKRHTLVCWCAVVGVRCWCLSPPVDTFHLRRTVWVKSFPWSFSPRKAFFIYSDRASSNKSIAVRMLVSIRQGQPQKRMCCLNIGLIRTRRAAISRLLSECWFHSDTASPNKRNLSEYQSYSDRALDNEKQTKTALFYASLLRPNAWCSTSTAFSMCFSSTTADTLISEVLTILI
jgi:hypothetical protein